MPLLPGICRPGMLLWNYDEVVETIHEYPNIVKGVFCGLVHHWGFQKDDYGIPHMVLPAVLETTLGQDGHGIIDAYSDKIILMDLTRLKWFGDLKITVGDLVTRESPIDSLLLEFRKQDEKKQALCL